MVTFLRTVLKDCKHKERNQRVVIQANYFRGKTLLLSIPPSDPCPPGKYMHMGERGSSAARSQCKPCAPGFFKSTTSKIVTCTAHTKCPPGKHTIASGSATSQPQCEKCATGFYKSITSRSSICAGRLGLFMSTRHYTIVARSWNRMHIFFNFITQMIPWWFYSCVVGYWWTHFWTC